MKSFTALALIGLMFVFSCSDSEKEQEKKEQTNIGQGINSLSKSSGKVSYQDENTLVFSSKDKKQYPVPERCKRELEQKSANTGSRSMQGGLTISAYTDFWPDSTVPLNDYSPYSGYILESRTYTYTSVINDNMSIIADLWLGNLEGQDLFRLKDTVTVHNSDYQLMVTRHIKDSPWNGYYQFGHKGGYYNGMTDWEYWEVWEDSDEIGVFRYSPYW